MANLADRSWQVHITNFAVWQYFPPIRFVLQWNILQPYAFLLVLYLAVNRPDGFRKCSFFQSLCVSFYLNWQPVIQHYMVTESSLSASVNSLPVVWPLSLILCALSFLFLSQFMNQFILASALCFIVFFIYYLCLLC